MYSIHIITYITSYIVYRTIFSSIHIFEQMHTSVYIYICIYISIHMVSLIHNFQKLKWSAVRSLKGEQLVPWKKVLLAQAHRSEKKLGGFNKIKIVDLQKIKYYLLFFSGFIFPISQEMWCLYENSQCICCWHTFHLGNSVPWA